MGASQAKCGMVVRRAGFTITELLVVVAIIMVLAGVAVGGYRRSKERGRQAVCVSNLHQIALALAMYSQDFDGFLPPYECGDLSTDGCEPYVKAALPYAGSQEIWFCPDDPFKGQDTVWTPWWVDHRYTSYVLRGGVNVRFIGSSSQVLGRDGWRQAHFGGCHHVFADGSVKWFVER